MKRYRKFRDASGRTHRVEMTWEEAQARDNYWLIVAVTPLVLILTFALAGGMI